VIVDLDTSGSISQKQLTEFLSEVVGILKQHNNVELTILSNDTEVYNPKTIQNPTLRDVAKYKCKGGGGTDHKPVFEWVNKNKPTAQVMICFTDGYSSFPKPSEVRINTIWVVSDGDSKRIPFGEIIELKRND
jgi:predicted metal-dependent peptidase